MRGGRGTNVPALFPYEEEVFCQESGVSLGGSCSGATSERSRGVESRHSRGECFPCTFTSSVPWVDTRARVLTVAELYKYPDERGLSDSKDDT